MRASDSHFTRVSRARLHRDRMIARVAARYDSGAGCGEGSGPSGRHDVRFGRDAGPPETFEVLEFVVQVAFAKRFGFTVEGDR